MSLGDDEVIEPDPVRVYEVTHRMFDQMPTELVTPFVADLCRVAAYEIAYFHELVDRMGEET